MARQLHHEAVDLGDGGLRVVRDDDGDDTEIPEAVAQTGNRHLVVSGGEESTDLSARPASCRGLN